MIGWFKRLMGGKPKPVAVKSASGAWPVHQEPAHPQPDRRVNQSPNFSAEWMRRRVAALQETSAGWLAIGQVLNPGDDPQVRELLTRLRGPHLFTPHVALNVLEEGCRRAIAFDAGASQTAAMQAALSSSEPFTR